MHRTTFSPSVHGFHFSNNDIRYSFNAFYGRQLCGGMTFASLDYYYNRMSIPETTSAPPIGSPLNNYILRRQLDAHHYAIPRLISGGSFESCLRADGAFGIIKRMINTGRPVPLLLSAEGNSLSTNSHWVTAIGYKSMPTSTYGCEMLARLYIYDNAQPDVETQLVPDFVSRNFRLMGTRGLYGFYAPFEGYRPVRPTAREMSVPANPDFSLPEGVI